MATEVNILCIRPIPDYDSQHTKASYDGFVGWSKAHSQSAPVI